MTKDEKKLLHKHVEALIAARDFCENMRDEMQEKFDGRSETWQQGDKGEQMSEDIQTFDNAYDSLDSLSDDLTGLDRNE